MEFDPARSWFLAERFNVDERAGPFLVEEARRPARSWSLSTAPGKVTSSPD